MKLITEDMLVDYLAGELPADDRALVCQALAEDPALAGELEELESLMEDIALTPEPEPSAAADERFELMLAAEVGGENTTSSIHEDQARAISVTPAATVRRLPYYQRPLMKLVGIAAAILLIFLAGRISVAGGEADLNEELASTRTLMLDLMKNELTSERIRATTVTFELESADPETTQRLGYMLRNDENANVRLAALEALRRFPNDPMVREELLAAMSESPPDVVRFELIETLVRANEKRILPYLEEIMDADSLPQVVRDVAEMASFKLI
ncbi:HEAT repeat domain-containing protein [Neolewinella persica]|uniref:HEAT repeat domain-containing protein n=1 Tax=Neolewinella persica TaxID=70998 RepID=UPI000365DC17|nr:HEAT repeat domain-containing protein [Neolewinella persica]